MLLEHKIANNTKIVKINDRAQRTKLKIQINAEFILSLIYSLIQNIEIEEESFHNLSYHNSPELLITDSE